MVHSIAPILSQAVPGSRLPAAIQRLSDIACNYWWSWSRDRETIFQDIDPDLWERCEHSPVRFLHEVSDTRLFHVAADPRFVARVQELAQKFDAYMNESDTWAKRALPDISSEHPVAYFCAEFGLHESIPIYSGGLGVLAGDHLKSASDLGVPFVGIGLLYRQGYFRQRLNRSGWQEDYYTDLPVDRLPLERVCDGDGQPLTVSVYMRQRHVKISVWKLQVGRVELYLMDTQRDDNDPVDRWLTAHLYGGNRDTRISQEIVLGIGGVRVLEAVGIQPAVYHLNEGHAAFSLLELCREAVVRTGKSFYDVEKDVKAKCVFTTHTPVPAGHDVFSPDLMDSYFASYWPELNLTREQFLRLGQKRLGDAWEPFSMTVLALRLCRDANGVSKIHGEVSRDMWTSLYPNLAKDEVPIGHITNGVHAHTWIAPLMADLYDRYFGPDWTTRLAAAEVWHKVVDIPDEELWARHQVLKEQLIAYTRYRVLRARRNRGEGPDRIHAATTLLSPSVLTLGFARRFSTYKRGDLIIRDMERALRLFGSSDRPVQIVFSGKAHPADEEGKRIIQKIMEWCQQPNVQNRVAFIEDYDLQTGRMLTQGVDVWINNPRRPLEASGTSGQKVCFNGGLNCSVLDGWWPEGYNGKNGWAVGHDIESADPEAQDRIDMESLYDILETEIVPLFYDRDTSGIPRGWIQRMKESIRTNCPLFNTDRMVADYCTQYYSPAAKTQARIPVLSSVR
ncbi:MAG: alpha-glucan family phosphorylase [Cyanobacteria bacterium P01_D01_bin.123]